MPSVATIEGMPILATSRPLISPATMPAARQTAMANTKLSVATRVTPKR